MSSVSTTKPPTPLRPDNHEGSNGTAATRQHALEIAAHQAFWLLRIGFTVAPILFGLDKFFNWSVDWPDYLAGWVNDIVPGSGQDWMYVLSGQLRLILGERDFTVKPGEAVEFSTWTPHWFGVVEEPVEDIMIFGAHGERLHLHT